MNSGKTRDGVLTALKFGGGLVSFCSALLAVVLILYSGYVLYDSMAVQLSAFSSNSDLLKYKPGVLAEGTNGDEEAPSLAEINPDYRAWITVKDSPIDYPIVQGKDDLYYASHDVYGNLSLTGAIYLAAANKPDFSDDYNLLYGHHMDNGAMFGSLDKFRSRDYFYTHQTAVLTTRYGKVYDVTFFSIVTTDAYEKQIYTVGNRMKKVLAFLTGDRSHDTGLGTDVLIYDRNVARGAVKVLALSTCANAATNGRLVLFGRMVEREKPQHKVKLTVKYVDEDGNEVFPDEVYIYEQGDNYYVVPPQKPGYDVDIRIVKGTITEDTVVIVTYTPNVWKLKIKYILEDGTEIAEPYEQEIRTDEKYDVPSPQIEGYKPLRLRVTGVNPGRDETFFVIYVPEDLEEYEEIDDYRVMTNLGDTCLQAGVCAE